MQGPCALSVEDGGQSAMKRTKRAVEKGGSGTTESLEALKERYSGLLSSLLALQTHSLECFGD
jgi:hypothetical protein